MNNLKITLSLALLMISTSFYAQNYNVEINDGRNFLRNQNYREACKSFIAAGIFTHPNNWEEVQAELDKVYTAIEVRQRELTKDLETTRGNLRNVTNERDRLNNELIQVKKDLEEVKKNLAIANSRTEELQVSLNACLETEQTVPAPQPIENEPLHSDQQAEIALQNEFIEILPKLTNKFLRKNYSKIVNNNELNSVRPEKKGYTQHIVNMFIKADINEKKRIIEAIRKILP